MLVKEENIKSASLWSRLSKTKNVNKYIVANIQLGLNFVTCNNDVDATSFKCLFVLYPNSIQLGT